MQYIPETIYVGKIITATWGQKLENMLARIGNYMGVVNSTSDLPDVQTASEGDWYVVKASKQIYAKIDGQWQTIGAISYDQLTGTVPREALSGTYDINITGEQAVQLKLKYQRTINGVPFDGTQNITITQSTPNPVTFDQSGAGQAPGQSFNGSQAVTISYNTIGAQPATHNHDSTYLKLTGGTMQTTNVVTNLNADMIDGFHQSQFASQSHNHDSTYLKLSGGGITGVLDVNQQSGSRLVLPVGSNKYAT